MLTTSIIDEHLSRARGICNDTRATKESCEGRCNNSSSRRAPELVHTVANTKKELSSVKRPTTVSLYLNEDVEGMAEDITLSNCKVVFLSLRLQQSADLDAVCVLVLWR